MAKFRNPISFTSHFGLAPNALDKFGVLNPTLNVDTRLFIDPLLLDVSAIQPFGSEARHEYESHFSRVIKLLRGSKSENDAPWKGAKTLLTFPEIKFTCLGFGAATISGSGAGKFHAERLIKTAKEIIDLGVEDPDLFMSMALLEPEFGPDRVSDMAANVILPHLVRLTERISDELGIPTEPLKVQRPFSEPIYGQLPRNPFAGPYAPVLLVPRVVLRNLPIATDWASVSDAAAKNEALRRQVNADVAKIWEHRSRKDKAAARDWALRDRASFLGFLGLIRDVDRRAYDYAADPAGEVTWRRLLDELPSQIKPTITAPLQWDSNSVDQVVRAIIEEFRHLVEERRYSNDLHIDGKPRSEYAAQRLFFVVAHAFCKANNIDVTPEAETGNGPVDFKFSRGFDKRVLVEVKLSTNTKLIQGISKQVPVYSAGEHAVQAYYVVLDFGQLISNPRKRAKLKATAGAIPLIVIDTHFRKSASKLADGDEFGFPEISQDELGADFDAFAFADLFDENKK